jgi:hypothetical protein
LRSVGNSACGRLAIPLAVGWQFRLRSGFGLLFLKASFGLLFLKASFGLLFLKAISKKGFIF